MTPKIEPRHVERAIQVAKDMEVHFYNEDPPRFVIDHMPIAAALAEAEQAVVSREPFPSREEFNRLAGKMYPDQLYDYLVKHAPPEAAVSLPSEEEIQMLSREDFKAFNNGKWEHSGSYGFVSADQFWNGMRHSALVAYERGFRAAFSQLRLRSEAEVRASDEDIRQEYVGWGRQCMKEQTLPSDGPPQMVFLETFKAGYRAAEQRAKIARGE